MPFPPATSQASSWEGAAGPYQPVMEGVSVVFRVNRVHLLCVYLGFKPDVKVCSCQLYLYWCN